MVKHRLAEGVTPYKPLQESELKRIEGRRKALLLPVSMLADRAGIDLSTMQRIRRSARAWPREIRAMKMALRSIEKERKAEAALFAAGD
jgi:hypothetical protein